jgi:hypothetical protein
MFHHFRGFIIYLYVVINSPVCSQDKNSISFSALTPRPTLLLAINKANGSRTLQIGVDWDFVIASCKNGNKSVFPKRQEVSGQAE